MEVFGANISEKAVAFFEGLIPKRKLVQINSAIYEICGIDYFFDCQKEINELENKIKGQKTIANEPDRTEYGDFQTNTILSDKICKLLIEKKINPKVVIEPTCGKGHFIVSCLKHFDNLETIYGIEIYKPYVWQTKFNILTFFIENPNQSKPKISIAHSDVFNFDFKQLEQVIDAKELLIIGNPPWVTNSKLSSLNSANLPKKSNFKKNKGLDAITGKGNFDIGEYISLTMLKTFSKKTGHFAFLIKNAVIKNIAIDQKRNHFPISEMEQYSINAPKEFNAAVNASLFLCKLNSNIEYTVNEFDFYSRASKNHFGWVKEKFVSNVSAYQKFKIFDGRSPFEWRQGVKHDCSKIMEFEQRNGHFINKENEAFEIENSLVYGLLKSSDLKGNTLNKSRKYTIITQNKIGQQTSYIKDYYPKTYNYLLKHADHFNKRKSSIYRNKPPFSIFGIGDYSFKPYKVAIAGLYKSTIFTLVLPQNDKCLMLDDTCYFIGFDNRKHAAIAQFLLNKKDTQAFLKSLAFPDSKRMITKDLLMRINLIAIAADTDFFEIKKNLTDIANGDWEDFKNPINQRFLF